MSSLINTTLLSIKRVERTDGHGTQKIVHEVELKYGKHGKTAAIIYYPTAYGIHLLKPGDRIEVNIRTQAAKWVNSLGDVDIVVENVVDYIERI